MTRVKYGKVKLGGGNLVNISYSGFSGPPSVCVTVTDTFKNGATAYVRDVTAGGCKCVAFYNGGMELVEGSILWIAVGPTSEQRVCSGPHHFHICHPDVYG